jgi:hypothetical protein
MKRFVSLTTMAAVVCCLCATSSFGKTRSDAKEPVEKSTAPAVTKTEAERNEKLRADITRLVSDAKAGKLKMPAQQFPQPTRNNLSKGAKIAIGVGIAAVIIFAILWHTTGPGSD